jgi:hypothetical protein
MQNQKEIRKAVNLGLSNETKFLVTRYRVLKALEHVSHKFVKNIDDLILEDMGEDVRGMKDLFISLEFVAHAENATKSEEYLHSTELSIQSALFRILKEKGVLEETVAELVYKEINKLGMDNEVDKEVVEDYAAHLKYCLSHPEVMKEYKLT